MKSLAFIQLSSYGAALEAVNSIAQYESIKCLEVISFGSYAQLFLEGQFDEINAFRKFLRTADLQLSEIIEYDFQIVNIFYHQEHHEVEKHILTMESPFVGSLFAAVAEAKKAGLKACEFFMPRFSGAHAIAIMTTSDYGSLEAVLKNPKLSKVNATFVENVTETLKSFLS